MGTDHHNKRRQQPTTIIQSPILVARARRGRGSDSFIAAEKKRRKVTDAKEIPLVQRALGAYPAIADDACCLVHTIACALSQRLRFQRPLCCPNLDFHSCLSLYCRSCCYDAKCPSNKELRHSNDVQLSVADRFGGSYHHPGSDFG